MQEGWIREGTLPRADESGGRSDRRRSLIGRLRRRRARKPQTRIEEFVQDWEPAHERGYPPDEPAADPPPERQSTHAPEPAPAPVPAPPRRRPRVRLREEARADTPPREPRRVHAVPTSDEHKIASAVDVFNGSEHRRTVAGVARSLGPPMVSVRPAAARPSTVNVVVAWELCWYRYEIDLSDDVPGVRVADQGIELDELEPAERRPNALSDENGALALDA
jgi:hypothetical protein